MPCYHPLQGYRSATTTKAGKRKLVFNPSAGFKDLPVTVPCGQCIGCRLERTRQWSVRLTHESQYHRDQCFLTLTYSDENLPLGGSLRKKDVQDFLKRLRRSIDPKIRYFYCGEYGGQTERAHYHMILFGYAFPDKKHRKNNKQGDPLFVSEELDSLWGLGQCFIGPVNPTTCAYVAGYITKKLTGDLAKEKYRAVVAATGEVVDRLPPFINMSLKPAIGARFYDEYATDVFPSDSVVIAGKEGKPPRYYDRRLENESPSGFVRVKRERIRKAQARAGDNTPERLRDKEVVRKAKTKFMNRDSI